MAARPVSAWPWYAELEDVPAAVVEVPLLFESGSEARL